MVSKTILIDDSEIDLFIQRRFLEVYQFANQLETFTTVKAALQSLGSLNGSPPPDIIFLDLNMPDVDGFGFLRMFKTLPEAIQSKTKIVVLTSSNNSKDQEEVMAHSSVIHFITKPLKQSDIEQLKTILSKS